MLDPRYVQAMRVGKTVRPGQPGARRAQKQHGAALVCVRYRYDTKGLYRLTTIELVVDHAPVHPRAFNVAAFGLRIGRAEHDLRRAVKSAGGRWDPHGHLWWLRGREIRTLGLVDRIVST